MRNIEPSSPSKTSRKRTGSATSPSKRGAKIIVCGFCNNTFSAVPRDAICLKCKRPANLPLSWFEQLLYLFLFPLGLLRAIIIRASRPYASSQTLMISIMGMGVWIAFYLLIVRR